MPSVAAQIRGQHSVGSVSKPQVGLSVPESVPEECSLFKTITLHVTYDHASKRFQSWDAVWIQWSLSLKHNSLYTVTCHVNRYLLKCTSQMLRSYLAHVVSHGWIYSWPPCILTFQGLTSSTYVPIPYIFNTTHFEIGCMTHVLPTITQRSAMQWNTPHQYLYQGFTSKDVLILNLIPS